MEISLILSVLSIFTYGSGIIVAKKVLKIIQCPILFASFINLINYIIYSVIKYYHKSKKTIFTPENAEVKPKSTELWVTALFMSISQIFLLINLKYNSVILYQITKLLVIPFMLFVVLFISSLDRTNTTFLSSMKNLLSFSIIVIGSYCYIINNDDVNFHPQLLLMFLSIIFSFINLVNKLGIANKYNMISHEKLEECLIHGGDLNAGFFNLSGAISLQMFVICLILGIFSNINSITSNTFYLIKPKCDTLDLLKQVLQLIGILIFDAIFVSIDMPQKTSSFLLNLIQFLILFLKPALLIIYSYKVYKSASNNLTSIITFLVGYFSYCFFEMQANYTTFVEKRQSQRKTNRKNKIRNV